MTHMVSALVIEYSVAHGVGGKELNMNGSEQFLLWAELRPDKVASFDSYPFTLCAVRNLGRLEFHPAVTFIVGENGSANPPCWKQWQWRGVSMPKAEARISSLRHGLLTPTSTVA